MWTDEDYVYELEPLDARGHRLALRPGGAVMLRTCDGSGDRSRYWVFEFQP
ncbi:hypothetical protein [Actinoplanes philippinensis]|uniref:hypothetical protein n=1 Tax=Actinoplanes philippinensis TaxID=35752 RepID=UPI0033C0AA1F